MIEGPPEHHKDSPFKLTEIGYFSPPGDIQAKFQSLWQPKNAEEDSSQPSEVPTIPVTTPIVTTLHSPDVPLSVLSFSMDSIGVIVVTVLLSSIVAAVVATVVGKVLAKGGQTHVSQLDIVV